MDHQGCSPIDEVTASKMFATSFAQQYLVTLQLGTLTVLSSRVCKLLPGCIAAFGAMPPKAKGEAAAAVLLPDTNPYGVFVNIEVPSVRLTFVSPGYDNMMASCDQFVAWPSRLQYCSSACTQNLINCASSWPRATC